MRMYACLFCLELRLLALALLNLAGACAILVYKVIVFFWCCFLFRNWGMVLLSFALCLGSSRVCGVSFIYRLS